MIVNGSYRRAGRVLAVSLILASAAMLPSAARAQDDVMASPDAKPVVGMPAPTPGRPATVAPTSDRTMSALHRLTADARQLRFEGETDTRIYPVFFTGNEATGHVRVRLAFSNAVSVMPEASRMVISVNDVVVGETAIASPASSDSATLDLDVPEGVIEPGYNALKIAVTQHHRVDCSIAATYELWTQLDPATTGFAFSDLPAESINDLVDLPALAPDALGSTPLRLVVTKGIDAATLDRSMRAVEAVAIRGRFSHPVVDVVDAPADAPGLDILVGTFDQLRNAGFADLIGDEAPTAIRPGRMPGHSTLVVSGNAPADVDAAIVGLMRDASTTPPPGTVAGLRAVALAGGTLIEGQKVISLRNLGLTSQEFSGRLFRAGFDILMPPDFYAADYGKMTLLIDAGYVGGLSQGSQILVRVNDRDAAALPLRNPNGDVFRDHPINVSLADLRPGFNHVQIEAQVSAPLDKACDVQSTLEGKKRFVLLDDSMLEMPSIARIAHLPNLASTSASGFPYLSGKDTPLYIPHPDTETISAIATFLARAAAAAGAPLSTRIVTGKPRIDDVSAIIIGAVNDIPTAMLEAVGIDAAGTRDAWAHVEAKSAANAKAAASARATDAANLAATNALAARDESALYQKWSANVSSDQWHFDPLQIGSNLLSKTIGLSSSSIAPWARIESNITPDAASRILVAQHAAPAGDGSTWTMVIAPTPAILAREMRTLTAASAWNKLDGRMSVLDPKTGVVTVTMSSQGYFIKTATLTPGNVRLIAAGWLSSHLEYYVLGLIALSLGLGLTTTAVVRRSGVKL